MIRPLMHHPTYRIIQYFQAMCLLFGHYALFHHLIEKEVVHFLGISYFSPGALLPALLGVANKPHDTSESVEDHETEKGPATARCQCTLPSEPHPSRCRKKFCSLPLAGRLAAPL